MGRGIRPCPCAAHKGALVPYHVWRRHVQKIATGDLVRWEETEDFEGPAAGPAEEYKEGSVGVEVEDHDRGPWGGEELTVDPIDAYASEIAELVARNRVTATGAEAMLKATFRHYDHVLPDTHSLPGTWYQCRSKALAGNKAKYFIRDLCVGCDYLFPLDPLAQECPSQRCGKPRCKDGRPQRQAYYYDIADKVRRLYGSKYSARHAAYGTSRDPPRGGVENRELHDCWDASILGALFHALDDPEKCHYLYLAQSNDGVEVEKNVTYTPITAKLLNLPPDLRGQASYTSTHCHRVFGTPYQCGTAYHERTRATSVRRTAVVRRTTMVRTTYISTPGTVMGRRTVCAGMLANIWLLGYLPPKVKNYQSMLQPLVDMFAKHAPGGEPISVYDAHLDTEVDKFIVCAWLNNDIRGVTNATCGKNPPALVGSCNFCCQGGQRHRHTTVLPGAVRALPTDEDDLQKQYEEEFVQADDVALFSSMERPTKRTKTSAIDSGNRTAQGVSKEVDEAYKDVDIYTTSLWYHDKIKHTLYDLAHQFANVVKHILKYMKNKKKADKTVFPPQARAYEVDKLGRFPDLAAVTGRRRKGVKKYSSLPWVSPPDRQELLDTLPEILKQPSKWPPLRSMFRDLGFMKTSETLLLAGDAGAYMLRLTGADPEYIKLYVQVLRIIQRYVMPL